MILLRINMPSCCSECPVFQNGSCQFNATVLDRFKRAPDCPFVYLNPADEEADKKRAEELRQKYNDETTVITARTSQGKGQWVMPITRSGKGFIIPELDSWIFGSSASKPPLTALSQDDIDNFIRRYNPQKDDDNDDDMPQKI